MAPIRSFHVAVIVAALTLLASACAMRVTGVVRDATSGQPIGGAVVTAEDGRNRMSVTDPRGQFAVKTDWRVHNMTFSAPGYETTAIQIPSTDRFPVISVDMRRAFPTADGAPLVEGTQQPLVGAAGAGESTTAGKLRELQALHDQGLISDQEYQRTRRKILETP
jgi:hypothetical protein